MNTENRLLPIKGIKEIYQYSGEILHVYAENKIAINIDLGFATWRRVPCTLSGVIVPKENGIKFKQFLEEQFKSNKKVLIRGFGYIDTTYRCELFSANEFPDRYYNNLILKAGIGFLDD